MSDPGLSAAGPDETPATTCPVLSIDVSREGGTVVVTLAGLLDEDFPAALVDTLWDLVVGQGNLSVAVDARRLTVSDPALMAVFADLEREAAARGGTLAVVMAWPPAASAERARAAMPSLALRRGRRVAPLGVGDHPAGGAPEHSPNHERSTG